jgi:hypothetical protein
MFAESLHTYLRIPRAKNMLKLFNDEEMYVHLNMNVKFAYKDERKSVFSLSKASM